MAVYTAIDRETLAEFLEGYDIGSATAFEGILQGIDNSNFRLETPAGRFVLTVFEARAAATDLSYFLALMAHLAAAGAPAPAPVRRRGGALLGEVAGKPAAIVAFLEGDWPRAPDEADARAAGRLLAELHLAGIDFPMRRDNDLGAAGWRPLFERSRARADETRAGLAAEITGLLDEIAGKWPRGLPAGAIHADLFPDNVLMRDGRVTGAIDFYFAADDAYAFDLAITQHAWCFDGAADWNAARAEALAAGYESLRQLTPEERAAIPLLRQGVALRFLLTRLYDWLHPAPDALVRPKDPLEQLDRLYAHRRNENP